MHTEQPRHAMPRRHNEINRQTFSKPGTIDILTLYGNSMLRFLVISLPVLGSHSNSQVCVFVSCIRLLWISLALYAVVATDIFWHTVRPWKLDSSEKFYGRALPGIAANPLIHINLCYCVPKKMYGANPFILILLVELLGTK